MKQFLLVSFLFLSACSQHYYRPVINGVVYDKNNDKPIAGAKIQFIHDKETLVQNRQINEDEIYYSDKFGRFSIERIKDDFSYNSYYRMALSWVFVVHKDGYHMDTVNLRNVDLKHKDIVLEPVWLEFVSSPVRLEPQSKL